MNRRDFLAKLMLTAGIGMMGRHAFADDKDRDGDDDGNDSSDKFNNKGTNGISFTPATTGITNKHVVVVGGGMAGATAAKYLRLWGGTGVSVTLVEPNTAYTSNIMSNLVLSGGRVMTSLNFPYAGIISKYGITLKQASVTGFTPASNGGQITVSLSDNTTLSCDRLIMAPGIQFDYAYGLTATNYAGNYPHAWQAGTQTTKLANLVAGMGNNDVFVMSIPAKPYRCPPGPYERACLVADYLKRNGKTGAKVIVLDENVGITTSTLAAPYNAIQAEPHSFHSAFTQTHAGIIEYHSGVTGISVTKSTANDGSGTVTYNDGTSINAKVISLIPPHRAPSVMGTLLNGGRWAPVDVLSYESTVTGMNAIHIIGDASSTTQPKAGHIANQEAKVCVDAILRAFQGQQPDQAPVTNSACYSPITNTTASWLTAVFHYDSNSKTMKQWSDGAFTGTNIEATAIDSKNFTRMNTWFNALMSDSFS
jgi:NADPH-dependent 2,4-dienoyl-CoA reductase/sulfur reductase-like enzyme